MVQNWKKIVFLNFSISYFGKKYFFNISKSYFEEFYFRFAATVSAAFNFFCCGYAKKDLLILYVLKLTRTAKDLDHFIFTDVTEILHTHFLLLFFLSTNFAIVFGLYHFVGFFFSGLRAAEKPFFQYIFLFVNFVLIVSLVLLNKIVFPHLWSFFMDYSQSDLFKTSKLYVELKVKSCVKFYVQTFYLTFYNCAAILLILNPYFLQAVKKRKHTVIAVTFSVTFMVPIDFALQLFIIITFLLFYELIYFFLLLKNWFFVLQKTRKATGNKSV